MSKLLRLDIDNVLSNLSLFTEHDIGGEGHAIIIDESKLEEAVDEITDNFRSLIEESWEELEEE